MRGVLVAVVIATIAWGLVPASAGAATNAADSAIVDTGLLRINDFPSGWTATARPSIPQPDVSKYGNVCAAIQKSWNAARRLPTARGESSLFKLGNAWISDAVTTHPTVAAARAGVAYLKQPGFTACIQRYNRDRDKGLKNGVTVTSSVTRLSVPSVGDSSFGLENKVTSTAKGHTSTAYSEVQDVEVGRTTLAFNFVGTSVTEHQALVRSIVSRVRAAEAT